MNGATRRGDAMRARRTCEMGADIAANPHYPA